MERKGIFIFKKLYSILVVLLCVFTAIGVYLSAQEPIFKKYSNTYEVALFTASSNASFTIVDSFNYRFLGDKKGESCEIDAKNFNLSEILCDLQANLVFTDELDDITCYYAYTDKIKNFIVIEGKKVNLHFAVKNDRVKLGSPIIFGGY